MSADTDYILTTWTYAAPEVLAYELDPCDERFEEVSFERQDAWSLGCILLWMLTGQEPFCLTQEEVAGVNMRDSREVQIAIYKRQLAWVRLLIYKPIASQPMQHFVLLHICCLYKCASSSFMVPA